MPPAKGKSIPQPAPLEHFNIDRGAAWYQCSVATPKLLPRATLVLERALDLISVYWDGKLLGTQWGIGDPLVFTIPGAIAAGKHCLDIRAEIWGHSNFHDMGNYATRLDAKRGIIGNVTLNNAPLNGVWRLAVEPGTPPALSKSASAKIFEVTAGDAVCFTRELERDYPLGAVLTLDAEQLHGEIWLDDWMAGRYVLGLLTPRDKGGKTFMTGGPANQFFLPGALARKGAKLCITARANIPGGRFERVALSEIEEMWERGTD